MSAASRKGGLVDGELVQVDALNLWVPGAIHLRKCPLTLSDYGSHPDMSKRPA